jgi:hypothetical protein
MASVPALPCRAFTYRRYAADFEKYHAPQDTGTTDDEQIGNTDNQQLSAKDLSLSVGFHGSRVELATA